MANLRLIEGSDPDYTNGEKLRKGGSGDVLVKRKFTSKLLACKEVNLLKKPRNAYGDPSVTLSTQDVQKMNKMVVREIQAMWELRGHENIVSFTGDTSLDTSSGIVRIYLGYYPGGALDDLILSHSLRKL